MTMNHHRVEPGWHRFWIREHPRILQHRQQSLGHYQWHELGSASLTPWVQNQDPREVMFHHDPRSCPLSDHALHHLLVLLLILPRCKVARHRPSMRKPVGIGLKSLMTWLRRDRKREVIVAILSLPPWWRRCVLQEANCGCQAFQPEPPTRATLNPKHSASKSAALLGHLSGSLPPGVKALRFQLHSR